MKNEEFIATTPTTTIPSENKIEKLVILGQEFDCSNIEELVDKLKDYEMQKEAIQTLKDTISLGYAPPKISLDDDKLDFSSRISLKISEHLNEAKTDLIRNWILTTCFPRELKALEIIKEKEVNVRYMKYYFEKGNGGYTEYKRVMNLEYLDFYPSRYTLTKEEFYFLKKVLK